MKLLQNISVRELADHWRIVTLFICAFKMSLLPTE